MKLTILGSGGATPTPRPFCQCPTCEKAREEGEPYKRNSSSLYVHDVFTLFDCPEDIGDSLNRRRIKRVDNLFITHWHPDHAYGLRPLLEAYFNFREHRCDRQVTGYIPQKVFEDIEHNYPSISYFTDHLKVLEAQHIEHSESVAIGNIEITAIGYNGKDSNIFTYLLEERGKRVLYAPCDVISLREDISDLDLLIIQCGVFSYEKITWEISFPALMERIRLLRSKKTVLTHIEEIEIQTWGWSYLDRMKKQYSDIDFEYAHDGMEIEL